MNIDVSISEIIEKSFKLVYDEHVGQLLSLPEKYLGQIKPNKQISFSEIFDGYNKETATCLNKYGAKLLLETTNAIKSQGKVSEVEKTEIIKTLEKYINPELYINRFDIFVGSIKRTMSRYSLEFDENRVRMYHPKSQAEIHAKNTCRKIQAKISNEIDLYRLNAVAKNSDVGVYRKLNDCYNKHQLAFWVIGIVVSLIIGVLFV